MNNQAYKLAGTVASLLRLNVTSSTFPRAGIGLADRGYLRVAGVATDDHESLGDTITLSAVLPGLAVGVAFEAFRRLRPDVRHLPVQVWQQSNFGGFPGFPPEPFAGDSIV